MGDQKLSGRGGGAPAMADETGEGLQCSDHPYRTNPGGICAFCLQEKLGKLVSSSKSCDPFLSILAPPSSSSSSSPPPPPFPSDLPSFPATSRLSFFSAKHRRRKAKTHSAAADSIAESLVLNRSKSVAAPSQSPRKKSFWSSFTNKRRSTSSASSPSIVASEPPKTAKEEEASTGNEDASPSGSQASSSFGRKVARSRSVGCGSRSFSGDFLERISNGFGDCTLRRVESHREVKHKPSSLHGRHGDEDEDQRIKERIRCGGIFVGLGMNANYWLSAAADDCGKLPQARRAGTPQARNRSWGWAFASPMRAFRPAGAAHQATAIAGCARIH